MMDQIKITKFSPDNMYSPNSQDTITVVLDNKKDPSLEGGHYAKIGGMWTLKREIISPKFYEIPIKTELKGNTVLDLRNFYKHINMCINAVTRLREDLLPAYHSIKIKSEFEEYFVPDHDSTSYSWNSNTYTSLGHSLLVELTNDNCVEYSMAPQTYKVVNTHAHEISGWKILSRLLHACAP